MKQKKGTPIRRNAIKIAVLCFWLLVWELLSLYLGSDILLASPISVLQTLLQLIVTVDFWQTILFSSLRIVAGFVMSMLVGMVLAIAAFRFSLLEELLSPLMKMIKTMPVASFIILALIWINSKNLSVLISFMMGLPMIYSNVMLGLRAADPKLLELAKVYGIGTVKKALAIYLPSTIPFLLAAISVGVGFCWKAGIAAEVIGVPSGSIGERLYEAKLYLMTKELLAWTIVIIIISAIFEKAVLWLLQSDRRERRH